MIENFCKTTQTGKTPISVTISTDKNIQSDLEDIKENKNSKEHTETLLLQKMSFDQLENMDPKESDQSEDGNDIGCKNENSKMETMQSALKTEMTEESDDSEAEGSVAYEYGKKAEFSCCKRKYQ